MLTAAGLYRLGKLADDAKHPTRVFITAHGLEVLVRSNEMIAGRQAEARALIPYADLVLAASPRIEFIIDETQARMDRLVAGARCRRDDSANYIWQPGHDPI